MFTIRVTGPDMDISIAITDEADLEMLEKIMAKIRSALRRSGEP